MMSWARLYRQFPGEGYLPVRQLAHVIFNQIRYRGWVSAEYFNADTNTHVLAYPFYAAERCNEGHELVMKDVAEDTDQDYRQPK